MGSGLLIDDGPDDKDFQSCAECGGSRKEVVWMNYEYYTQVSLMDLWQQNLTLGRKGVDENIYSK